MGIWIVGLLVALLVVLSSGVALPALSIGQWIVLAAFASWVLAVIHERFARSGRRHRDDG